ncbi:hypothetical protein MKX01_021325 [Papaver californicum]|nr:hypothetical protein MKX01_021325 [Papaver californicum]
MDNSADTLNNVYLEFVGVVAGALEANEIFECLVDETTGSLVTGKSGETITGLPPISVVCLEQMSKMACNGTPRRIWCIGAAAHTPSFVPFDARFFEGADQQVLTNSTIC